VNNRLNIQQFKCELRHFADIDVSIRDAKNSALSLRNTASDCHYHAGIHANKNRQTKGDRKKKKKERKKRARTLAISMVAHGSVLLRYCANKIFVSM